MSAGAYGDEHHYNNRARNVHRRCTNDPDGLIEGEVVRGHCRHDLGRGVLVSELLSDDGPADDPVARALLERLLSDYCPD